MSETSTMQGGGMPLAENEHVKELFGILQDNNRDTSGLSAIIGHVGEMESFIKRSEEMIAKMKAQLDSMKEVQNHPIKTYLQNAIKMLEQKVTEVKERIGELKDSIIEGCKNAVTACKEKGLAVLNSIASFFGFKQNLQDLNKDIDRIITQSEKAVAKIEAFSNEYHSAGRAMKNMARMAVGKKPIDAKKEAGKLAQTLAAPYKIQKSALIGLKKSVNRAVAKLEQLDAKVTARKAERAVHTKKPLTERLEAGKNRVAKVKLNLPPPGRTKVQGAEL